MARMENIENTDKKVIDGNKGIVKKVNELPLTSNYTIGFSATKTGYEIFYLFEYKDPENLKQPDSVFMIYKNSVMGHILDKYYEMLKFAVFKMTVKTGKTKIGTFYSIDTLEKIKNRELQDLPDVKLKGF